MENMMVAPGSGVPVGSGEVAMPAAGSAVPEELAARIAAIKSSNRPRDDELAQIEQANYEYYLEFYTNRYLRPHDRSTPAAAAASMHVEDTSPMRLKDMSPMLRRMLHERSAPEATADERAPDWGDLKRNFLAIGDNPLAQAAYIFRTQQTFPDHGARVLTELTYAGESSTLPHSTGELYDVALDHAEERINRMRLKMWSTDRVNAADVVHFAGHLASLLERFPDGKGLPEVYVLLIGLVNDALAKEQTGIEPATMASVREVWNPGEMPTIGMLQRALQAIGEADGFNGLSPDLIPCYTPGRGLDPTVELGAKIDISAQPEWVIAAIRKTLVETEGVEDPNLPLLFEREAGNPVLQLAYVTSVLTAVNRRMVELDADPLPAKPREGAAFERFAIYVQELFLPVQRMQASSPPPNGVYEMLFQKVREAEDKFSPRYLGTLKRWREATHYEMGWPTTTKLEVLSRFVDYDPIGHLVLCANGKKPRTADLQACVVALAPGHQEMVARAVALSASKGVETVRGEMLRSGGYLRKNLAAVQQAAAQLEEQFVKGAAEEEVDAAGAGMASGSPMPTSPARPRNSPHRLGIKRMPSRGLLSSFFGTGNREDKK